MGPSSETRHHLVLVGGGHSHVEVLRDWTRAPAPGVHVTMVADSSRAVYSSMVPGFVAGQYRLEEIEIDVERLARKAGAAWLNAPAPGLNLGSRQLHVHAAPPLRYDTMSFDVGSTVSGLDRPGIKEHALPTRPIAEFARMVDAMIERARTQPGFRLVVVGAGAGGVELAFAFRARFNRLPLDGASVGLLESGPRSSPAIRDRRRAASRVMPGRAASRSAAAWR